MSYRSFRRFGQLLTALVFLGSANAALALPGDLDASFGNHGRTIIDIPGYRLQPNSLIQTSDGKTAIIGWREGAGSNPFDWDYVVVRLSADGTLDTTFGVNGITTVNFFDSLDQGVGIVQQPDGKLVVVGVVNGPGCTPCMGVVRLTTTGALDATFGSGGKVTLGAPAVAIGVVMQGDNLVVGGHLGYNDFEFVRVTSNGALDPTFGSGGAVIVDLGSPMLMGRMIAQSDGKIIAVGGYPYPGTPVMGATRIDANGVLDTSFNGTGIFAQSCIGPCAIVGVAQQSDGKLIFTGWTSLPGTGSPLLQQEDSFIERRNLDGTLDASFGSGGRVTTLFKQAYGVHVQSGERATHPVIGQNGNITVVGRITDVIYDGSGNPLSISWSSAVSRLTSTGAIDTSFGHQGATTIPFSQGDHVYGIYWEGINLLNDGRLLVMGLGIESGPSGITNKVMGVARLSADAGDAGVITAESAGAQTESIGSITFSVARVGGSAGAVSVSYATVSGTAIAGSDFSPVSGTLHWADGEYGSRGITVPIISDGVVENSNESFQLVLSNSTGGADIAVGTASTTIVRDDIEPTSVITVSQTPVAVSENAGSVTLTVTRTGTNPVSVNYFTGDRTARAGVDYTAMHGILVWGTGDTAPKTITIPILNDAVYSSSRNFNLVLLVASGGAVFGGNTATVVINDDDPPPQIGFTVTAKTMSEAAGLATFEVARVGVTSQPVSVSYATSNGTATAGSDYQAIVGTLSWAPNDPSTKTIVVPLLDDALYEGNQNENFGIALSNPTGGAVLGASNATATLVDNDPAPQLSFTVVGVTVKETDSSALLTVIRQGTSGLIHSVNFATANGTARAGRDYVATSGALTWLPTDPDLKLITVPIVRQSRRERNETFTVTLSNPTNNASIGLATTTVTITERPRH